MSSEENEFFHMDNNNMSKSAILPNEQFDKQHLEDEHGIERPFTNSEHSIQHINEDSLPQTTMPFPPEMEQCNNCGRRFFVGRLQLHQKTCTPNHPQKLKLGEQDLKSHPMTKTSTPKKKKKKGNKSPPMDPETILKLPKWKLEHQQVMDSMRYSREVEKAEKQGHNINEAQDRVPRSILEESYIFCQYCQRKFAPHVAENHIPRCKNIFNRPLPPKMKSFDDGQKKPVKALEKYSQYVGSSINEEQDEVDNDLMNPHSQTAKQQTQTKIFREHSNHQRMSQSQQQTTGGHSVFLPRLQKSPLNTVSQLSKSTPMVKCQFCNKSIDQRQQQKHRVMCQKTHHIKEYQSVTDEGGQLENSEKQFCTNCGAKFARIHKYCGICGKKRKT